MSRGRILLGTRTIVALLAYIVGTVLAKQATVLATGELAATWRMVDGVQTFIFEDDELQDVAAKQETLLLVVVGKVYDVTSGRQYYGKINDDPESYAGFASGHDYTRAFLSADFEQNATDYLLDLLPGQCLGIHSWETFYQTHENYTFAGLHRGRFYNVEGKPTSALGSYRACVARGEEARVKARAAVAAAPRCASSTPTTDEPRFRIGTWRTHACTAPLVPRRTTVDAAPVCACLQVDTAAAEGWDASALGMEDDQEMPQRYGSQCEVGESSCTVREM